MIFVTLGSQKFQFNRLLMELDRLVSEGKITCNLFAQIGYSDYHPLHYQYKEFMDRDEFQNMMNQSDIVICHGGTGAIISSVKKGKKVIAIPRLCEYKEHVDNHQIQIVEEFSRCNLILGIKDVSELEGAIFRVHDMNFDEYLSNTKTIIDDIDNYMCGGEEIYG